MPMKAALVLAGMVVVLAGCSAPPPDSTIAGQVDLGPFCPVEQPGSPCPRPSAAFTGVQVTAQGPGGPWVAPVATDGSFRVQVPVGTFQVTADAGMGCATVNVTAPAQNVLVTCDTGIR